MKRKYIFPVIFICLLSCLLIELLVFFIRNNRNTANENYFYDLTDPTCSYSENTVLYLDGSNILHLIDTSSGKDIIYCDKPNCKHEPYSKDNPDPSCPAAFMGQCAGPVLFNGHLYIIGDLTDGRDMMTQYLYEMDSDGENRKKASVLHNVQSVKQVLYRDKYVIGSYLNTVEAYEDTDNFDSFAYENILYDMYSYDIVSGKKKLLKTFDHVYDIKMSEGNIFYSAKDGYFMYDKDNDNIKELNIKDKPEEKYGSIFTNNGSLYYSIKKDDS